MQSKMPDFTPEQAERVRIVAKTLRNSKLAISDSAANEKAIEMVLTEIKQKESEQRKKGLFDKILQKEPSKPKIDIVEPEVPDVKPEQMVNIEPEEEDNNKVSEIMQDAGVDNQEILEADEVVTKEETVENEPDINTDERTVAELMESGVIETDEQAEEYTAEEEHQHEESQSEEISDENIEPEESQDKAIMDDDMQPSEDTSDEYQSDQVETSMEDKQSEEQLSDDGLIEDTAADEQVETSMEDEQPENQLSDDGVIENTGDEQVETSMEDGQSEEQSDDGLIEDTAADEQENEPESENLDMLPEEDEHERSALNIDEP